LLTIDKAGVKLFDKYSERRQVAAGIAASNLGTNKCPHLSVLLAQSNGEA
jgi:hypothetical protein